MSRTYHRAQCVSFRKTNEAFGGLSNMAGGYPIVFAEFIVPSSEALYQAARFPHLPELQYTILAQKSPMTAKMKSKPFRHDSRADWDTVRVRVMRWVLRAKLYGNERFRDLLLATEEYMIVEESKRDRFWGAIPVGEEQLEGDNVLGRLLMELRLQVRRGAHMVGQELPLPDIDGFRFLNLVPTPLRCEWSAPGSRDEGSVTGSGEALPQTQDGPRPRIAHNKSGGAVQSMDLFGSQPQLPAVAVRLSPAGSLPRRLASDDLVGRQRRGNMPIGSTREDLTVQPSDCLLVQAGRLVENEVAPGQTVPPDLLNLPNASVDEPHAQECRSLSGVNFEISEKIECFRAMFAMLVPLPPLQAAQVLREASATIPDFRPRLFEDALRKMIETGSSPKSCRDAKRLLRQQGALLCELDQISLF
jgi:ribA/ribD-fused uncharacterized protein